ncbi:MAG: hypothetical protein U0326_42490 [Polyangiales bacterium]
MNRPRNNKPEDEASRADATTAAAERLLRAGKRKEIAHEIVRRDAVAAYWKEIEEKLAKLDAQGASEKKKSEALAAFLDGHLADQFLYVGTDLKGQAQYVHATSTRKLSAELIYNPFKILGVHSEIAVEGSAEWGREIGLLVMRGPSEPFAEGAKVTRPIVLHSFAGTFRSYTLGATVEFGLGVEAAVEGKLTYDDGEEPEDGKATEEDPSSEPPVVSGAGSSSSPWSLEKPEGVEAGIINADDFDAETCIELFSLKAEAKVGVRAGAKYTYETWCAVDQTPAYYAPGEGKELRRAVLDVLREGSTKAVAKARAVRLINEHPELWEKIELEKSVLWVDVREGSLRIIDRINAPRIKEDGLPACTASEEVAREAWLCVEALLPYVTDEKHACKRRAEAIARWHPVADHPDAKSREYGRFSVYGGKGPSASSEDVVKRLKRLSPREGATRAQKKDFERLTRHIEWRLDPFVSGHPRWEELVGRVESMFRQRSKLRRFPGDIWQLRDFLLEQAPTFKQYDRTYALEVVDEIDGDELAIGGGASWCNAFLIATSHAADGEAAAFASAEAKVRMPGAQGAASAEVKLSLEGRYKSAFSRFQTVFAADSVPASARKVYCTWDTRVRYTSFSASAKAGLAAEGGVANKVGSREASKEASFEPKRLNRVRYQSVVAVWSPDPKATTADANVQMLPGTGVVFGESLSVHNLVRVYRRFDTVMRKSNLGFFADEDPYLVYVGRSLGTTAAKFWRLLLEEDSRSFIEALDDAGEEESSVIVEATFRVDPSKLAVKGSVEEVNGATFASVSRRSLRKVLRAPREIESMRLRYRRTLAEDNTRKSFPLGFGKAVGVEIGVRLERIDRASTDGIVDVSTSFFHPKLRFHVTPDVAYERAVPPAILFCQ